MGKNRQWLHYVCILISLLCCTIPCYAIESPQYTVVRSASDLEIRLYKESSWMSAYVPGGTSFENSTDNGFHRLYQYIHGSNLNSSRLKMTAPVLTSISQAAASGITYKVKFYLPKKYEGTTPQPYPELNLQIENWRSHCVAVKKFTGFAKDVNIGDEKDGLMSGLDKLLNTGKSINAAYEDRRSYAIAQYNASFHLSGRLNEVWMNLLAEGCLLS